MGEKSLVFWFLTLVCFSTPFLFYFFGLSNSQSIVLQPQILSKPLHITVHITGAVEVPGVYHVKPGTKLHELLRALNLSTHADLSKLNLAKTLRDGQKITIKEKQIPKIVNLNLASIEDLKSLPGIGNYYASKILLYRERSGAIKSIEEVKQLIGKKRAEKLNSKISF